MAIEQFLVSIKPGLTLYGILLTFGLVSFGFGKFFWKYEREICNENIQRIKDLMGGFRTRYIEPMLKGQFNEAFAEGYKVAIGGLTNDFYIDKRNEVGELKSELVDDSLLKEMISKKSLQERRGKINPGKIIEEFLASASGQELFDNLDHAYDRQWALFRSYHSSVEACRRTCYSFFVLSILLLAGIIRILREWPDALFFFWLFITLLVLAYAIFSFVRLEVYRRSLLKMWQELEIYGKV